MSAELSPTLTAAEAAEILRLAPWTVTRECRSGALRASYYARTWHITREAIADYLEQHSNVPAAEQGRRRRRRAS